MLGLFVGTNMGALKALFQIYLTNSRIYPMNGKKTSMNCRYCSMANFGFRIMFDELRFFIDRNTKKNEESCKTLKVRQLHVRPYI